MDELTTERYSGLNVAYLNALENKVETTIDNAYITVTKKVVVVRSNDGVLVVPIKRLLWIATK